MKYTTKGINAPKPLHAGQSGFKTVTLREPMRNIKLKEKKIGLHQ